MECNQYIICLSKWNNDSLCNSIASWSWTWWSAHLVYDAQQKKWNSRGGHQNTFLSCHCVLNPWKTKQSLISHVMLPTSSYFVAPSGIKHKDENAQTHCGQPVNNRVEPNRSAKNMSTSLCFSCLFDFFLLLFFSISTPSSCSPHHLLHIQADRLFVYYGLKHQLNKFTVTAFEATSNVMPMSSSLSFALSHPFSISFLTPSSHPVPSLFLSWALFGGMVWVFETTLII